MKAQSFLWFTIVLSACSYRFSEDRNLNVVPAPASKIVTINLDEVGTDTLFFYEPVNLKYNVTGLFAAEAKFLTLQLVNTSSSYGMTALSGTVTLVPPSNTKGLFQLRLTVYAKSGSGSLADKEDAETILYMKEWPAIVNTQPPDPLHITSIERADGSLKIEWEKYDLNKFSSYVFIRTTSNSYNATFINDPDSNFYYDRKFLSGEANYSVTLVTDGGANPVAGQVMSYSDTTTVHLVKAEKVNSNQSVKLTWSRGRYPANIKRFEVRVGEANFFGNGSVILDTQTITDTTITIPGILDWNRHFFVRSTPSITTSYANDNDQVIKESMFRSGEMFPSYVDIRFSSPAGRFYTLSVTHMTAYSMVDCSVIKSYPLTEASDYYRFEVTPAGDKVVVVEAHNHRAVVYDAVSFLPVSQFDFGPEIPAGDIVWSLALTQGNQAYITKTHLTPVGPNLAFKQAMVVYALATGSLVKIIDQGPLPPVNGFAISDGQSRVTANNQFVYYESRINIGNGAVAKIQNDVVVESLGFSWPLPNPSNANQVLNAMYAGNKIAVFDLQSSTYVNIINTYSDFSPTDFLPERSMVVGYRAGAMGTVFDYATQQTLFTIKAQGLPLTLEGDYLYTSSGARIRIN